MTLTGEDIKKPAFDALFRAQLRDLLSWRRDVRRFRPDALPEGALDRLIQIGCLAPSVGLSEPWRFVIVDDDVRRSEIRGCFAACNEEALRAQPDSRAETYARLKLAGLDDAPVHLAVFSDPTTAQGHGLGRHTMPRTIEYSAVLAVYNLWLAARAEGIGLGWVSILDPARVATILDVPSAWAFIGYLCLGYPIEEHDTPTLERDGWEHRRAPATTILRR